MKLLKYLKLSALLATLVVSQNSLAISLWGKVKNALNDCEYSDQEYQTEYNYQYAITSKLPEHFSGRFSESDFDDKPWMKEFHYVIVVDKSETGPTAQTMRVFEYGTLLLQAKISTGREKFELRRKNNVCAGAPPKSYWSQTPTGYYTPKYLDRYHNSSSWDSDMPFAIFFDVDNGLALHQVSPHYVDRLGTRASGGCVRQDEGTAEFLFKRVLATEGQPIPQINEDGTPVLNDNGDVKRIKRQVVVSKKNGQTMTFDTYSALIIIENPKPWWSFL
ncbi:MAG: L,D-transpeptidase [Pseudobdellovibrionaceae bacterium]